MLCIQSDTTNPYFNIASEEYLLKSFSEDVFMLYINKPSVIVGKHQNTLAEIDSQLVKQKGINVVRRLSGGGSVYHDFGNLNFTFIRNGSDGKLVDFRGFTQPIVDLLGELGVIATFEGHNSLYVDGKKISGNAEHIFKNRVMHHGTLLFDADMQTLAEVLYVNVNRYSDTAVKSVRAKTANLSEYLPQHFTIESFATLLMDYMLRTTTGSEKYELSRIDHDAIDKLIAEKYSKWDWNFGYSPSYAFSRRVFLNVTFVEVALRVERGVISEIQFPENLLNLPYFKDLSTALMGVKHTEEDVAEALAIIELPEVERQSLLSSLF
ncbi:MAG: lipoate--protein ligase [Tenuifilaceae bacterium]|jgi:lipoate-protein ligase A|nr:lipoate--protein ligase [Tenuifilaceae bacterium]